MSTCQGCSENFDRKGRLNFGLHRILKHLNAKCHNFFIFSNTVGVNGLPHGTAIQKFHENWNDILWLSWEAEHNYYVLPIL
jgi:hypothetical protein